MGRGRKIVFQFFPSIPYLYTLCSSALIHVLQFWHYFLTSFYQLLNENWLCTLRETFSMLLIPSSISCSLQLWFPSDPESCITEHPGRGTVCHHLQQPQWISHPFLVPSAAWKSTDLPLVYSIPRKERNQRTLHSRVLGEGKEKSPASLWCSDSRLRHLLLWRRAQWCWKEEAHDYKFRSSSALMFTFSLWYSAAENVPLQIFIKPNIKELTKSLSLLHMHMHTRAHTQRHGEREIDRDREQNLC